MAVLAHVLQLVGGWIGPLVIFLIKRQSRFVSFHALQVLFLHLACVVVAAILVAGGFISFLLAIALHHGANNSPPLGIFILFPLVWLGFIGAWAAMVVIAVLYGVKAGRGEWAEYPVFGRLARRVLQIGPGGAPMQS